MRPSLVCATNAGTAPTSTFAKNVRAVVTCGVVMTRITLFWRYGVLPKVQGNATVACALFSRRSFTNVVRAKYSPMSRGWFTTVLDVTNVIKPSLVCATNVVTAATSTCVKNVRVMVTFGVVMTRITHISRSDILPQKMSGNRFSPWNCVSTIRHEYWPKTV